MCRDVTLLPATLLALAPNVGRSNGPDPTGQHAIHWGRHQLTRVLHAQRRNTGQLFKRTYAPKNLRTTVAMLCRPWRRVIHLVPRRGLSPAWTCRTAPPSSLATSMTADLNQTVASTSMSGRESVLMWICETNQKRAFACHLTRPQPVSSLSSTVRNLIGHLWRTWTAAQTST